MADERPNVLFVMDDQHSARCLGCYGNETVRTPTLDRLAEEGVRFERAYAQSPICMPSRTSIFTGQYPNTVGVYGNYGGLDPDVLSLAQHLNTQGYETGAFGKLHLPVNWPTHGFDTRRSCDFADAEQHEEENDYYAYLKRVGYDHEYDMGIGSQAYPFSTYVSNVPAEHCVEKWTADEMIRWLNNRKGDAPFFAWTTFQRPHPPYAPPPEYAGSYSPEDIDLPPRQNDEFETKPQSWRDRRDSERYRKSDERDIKQAVAYYYSLITLIDEQIGRIIDHLNATGELENTIVVFASDHGDFAGEHGFVKKTLGVPEAVHRVPFIWRYPAAFERGSVRNDLVELLDVFPTVCDLLDIPTPEQAQGRSLEATLTEGESVGRDAAYCISRSLRTIRTDDWKLTYYVEQDDGELYNMADDPWEHDNLYHCDDYRDVKTDLLTRLFAFHVETEDPAIPSGGIPSGTAAHATWSKKWWDEGGTANATPLDHLGGPGYPWPTDENTSD
jgi:choline-sulfatase